MKIKIIIANYVENLQGKIDEFLAENEGIEVISTQLNSAPMHDLYTFGPPQVCNVWEQHTFTIVYK